MSFMQQEQKIYFQPWNNYFTTGTWLKQRNSNIAAA
jgi:hypothetical protein